MSCPCCAAGMLEQTCLSRNLYARVVDSMVGGCAELHGLRSLLSLLALCLGDAHPAQCLLFVVSWFKIGARAEPATHS